MISSLQCPQRSAQFIGQSFKHTQANDHIGFPSSVSVLGDGGEGNANDSFLVKELGKQIDMERLNAVLENHNPVVIVLGLTDSPRHHFSLSKDYLEAQARRDGLV